MPPTAEWDPELVELARRRALAAELGGAERVARQHQSGRRTVPFRTAEAFLIEDVIDPADTRPLLCEWVQGAYATLAATPLGETGRGLRP